MSLFSFCKEFILKYRQNEPTSKTVFDHYFFDSKYYLRKEASTDDFSSLLEISPEKLDQFSKANYSIPFELLLNEQRYIHFMNELENSVNANLSFESIIKLCGYENNDKFVDFVKAKRTQTI
jgi:methylphosphotriester-DNA--protein-cysteine methyltransferase